MAAKASSDSSQKNIQSTAKTILSAESPSPLLLVVSPDRVRRERFVNKYLDTFARTLGADSLISSFDCREFDSGMRSEIREATQTYSLFSSRQFVVLHYLDALKVGDAKDLSQLLSDAGSGSCIIGVSPKLASTSPIFKTFQKSGAILIFEELKGETFRRWAERECAAKGVENISERALSLLIQMSQGDFDTFVQLLDVAALYADNKTLDESDINTLFRVSISHSEFALVDEIVSGSTQRARMLLSELLSEGKNPFGLIAIISRSISQVMTIRLELDKGRAESHIRDVLQMPPWQYNKLVSHARRIPIQRLRKAVHNLLKADIRLKSRSVSIEDIMQDVVAPL